MFKKIGIFILAISLSLTTSMIGVFAEGEDKRIFVKPGETVYLTGDGALVTDGFEYYSGVAEAETITTTGGDAIIHLGNNKEFNDGIDTLTSCLYKFEKVTDGKYKIHSVSTNPTYYFRTAESNVSIFHSENENIMKVDSINLGENGNTDMYFGFTQDGTNRRLFFEYVYSQTPFTFNKCYFNQLTNESVSVMFRIYEQKTSTEGIKYERVNSLDEITNTGKYIIAARTDNTVNDNTLYVLKPANVYNSFAQTAKWVTTEKEASTTEVKVTVSGTNDGGYSCFKIGSKTYRISKAKVPTEDDVSSDLRIANGGAHNGEIISKLTISMGDSYKVAVKEGDTAQYWMSADDGIASVDQDGTIHANSVTDQGFGKTYIGYMDNSNNMHCIEVVVVNTATSADTTHTDLYLDQTDNKTVIYYSFILDNMAKGHDSYEGVSWPGQAIKEAYDKEVFYIDTENREQYAIVFFAKTENDREFVTNDILSIDHSTNAEDKKFYGVDPNKLSDYPMLTNVFKEEYVTELLTEAKNQDFVASVVLNKPTQGVLDKHLKIGSSYIIDLVEPHAVVDGKTYALNVKDFTEDTSTYKEKFNLSTNQYKNSKFFDIYISEDGTKLENAKLSKKLSFNLDVSELQDYDHTKIKYRTFQVYSVHKDNVIDWGEYSADSNNKITVKADKYSVFVVVAKNHYVSNDNNNSSNNETQPTYIAPNTGVN